MKIKDAMKAATEEEAAKLVNQEELKEQAIFAVENNGIVFLDEVDKICKRGESSGPDVSREGVQRDLLPLVEAARYRPSTVWLKLTIFCLLHRVHSRLRNHRI